MGGIQLGLDITMTHITGGHIMGILRGHLIVSSSHRRFNTNGFLFFVLNLAILDTKFNSQATSQDCFNE